MSPEKLSRIYEFVERFLEQGAFEEFVKLMEADEEGNPPRAKDDRTMALDSLPPTLRRRVVADIERREGEAKERFEGRWPKASQVETSEACG
jgi:hypothetical protein